MILIKYLLIMPKKLWILILVWVLYFSASCDKTIVSMKILRINCPVVHFTSEFTITIQMPWQIRFALIHILMNWPLPISTHDTTAVLPCHVQHFLAPGAELLWNKFSVEFELLWKCRLWNTPLILMWVDVIATLMAQTQNHWNSAIWLDRINCVTI